MQTNTNVPVVGLQEGAGLSTHVLKQYLVISLIMFLKCKNLHCNNEVYYRAVLLMAIANGIAIVMSGLPNFCSIILTTYILKAF